MALPAASAKGPGSGDDATPTSVDEKEAALEQRRKDMEEGNGVMWAVSTAGLGGSFGPVSV